MMHSDLHTIYRIDALLDCMSDAAADQIIEGLQGAARAIVTDGMRPDEDRGERHNDADVAEAAAQTMQDIDGPLEQAGEEVDDKPAWHGPVEKLRKMIAAAKDRKSHDSADSEFQKIAAGLPDDIYNQINAALIDKARELRGREG